MERAQQPRDDAEDESRRRDADSKACQRERKPCTHAARAEAGQIADARENLAEDGPRQGIGHRDELAIEISTGNRAALHKETVGNRQVSIATAK